MPSESETVSRPSSAGPENYRTDFWCHDCSPETPMESASGGIEHLDKLHRKAEKHGKSEGHSTVVHLVNLDRPVRPKRPLEERTFPLAVPVVHS